MDAALFDVQRSGRPSEITDDAKAWMISIACQKNRQNSVMRRNCGHWPLSINTFRNMQRRRDIQDFQPLRNLISRNSSAEQDMKPFKIKYYCEKRDPDFETKMHEVLLVYKQIEMQFDENGDLIVPDDYKLTITVSYHEKPGIQAISNTAPDLRPTPEHGEVYRDAEYKRLGTLSLLAGIDLLTGEAIPLVSETHKSSDFISF